LFAHDLFGKPVPTPHQVRGRLFRIMRASLFFAELLSRKNLFAAHPCGGIPAIVLDGTARFPYLQRRDTSPQREAYYLEG
jgi:hypothetical protein